MDINIATIGIMFTSTAGSGSVQSEFTTTCKVSQSATAAVDNSHQVDACQTAKADNNFGISKDKLTDSSPPDFRHVLSKEASSYAATPSTGLGTGFDTAEIKRPLGRRQHDGQTRAETQSPLATDISTLNLPASVTGQKLLKAATVLGTNVHIITNNYPLQQVKTINPSIAGQPVGAAKWTGLKPICDDASNSMLAGLKEQAAFKNGGKEPASLRQEMECLKFQRENSKPIETEPGQRKSVGMNAMAAATNGKKPLPDKFSGLANNRILDTNRQTAESPKKPQLPAEKMVEYKSRGVQGLAKFTASEKQIGDASANSTSRTLNGIQSEICSAQTKNAGSFGSNGSVRPQAGKFEIPVASQTVLSEQSTTLSQTTGTANDAPPGNLTGSISQQIAVHIEGSLRQADTNLTIYLNPPELGKVFVRFQQQQDQITVLLEVSKPETKYEIEQALPQIMRTLQDSGIEVRRLEVQLSNELAQQADKDELSDNSEMPQHRSGFPRDGGASGGLDHDNGSVHEWLTSTAKDHYPDDLTPQMVYSSGSFNVLM
jgi:flagellar hook-length control protein FliK